MVPFKGDQDMPLQRMPLKDYFELKITKKQQIQGDLFAFPLSV